MNEYLNQAEILAIIDGTQLINAEAVSIDVGGGVDMGMDPGMYEEIPMDGPGTTKDPIMSSMLFVVGISVVTLAISIGIGILLAKRKIKKGFELYED